MTVNEFLVLCEKLHIAPAIALENDKLREALRKRDDQRVRELIETEC